MYQTFSETIVPYLKAMATKWWGLFFGLFIPIQDLIVSVFFFIAVDFVIGCIASHKRIVKSGGKWKFSSRAAYYTIYKFGFSIMAIYMAYALGENVINDIIDISKLPNMICGIICVVEFWSFLENASEISESKVFAWIKKYTVRKAKKFDQFITDDDIDELTKNKENDKK